MRVYEDKDVVVAAIPRLALEACNIGPHEGPALSRNRQS